MKKQKVTRYLGFILLVGLSGILGYLGGKFGATVGRTLPAESFLALVALIIPIFFTVIAVHEGGHALAGVYVNFDFRMYVVGPFLWEREQFGWKFKWNKNVNTAGGMVICLPRSTDDLPKRFARYAVGGPAASLVLAALAMLAYLSIQYFNDSTEFTLASLSLFFLALMSGAIFLVTIVPYRAGGFSSDGARILQMLRGGDTSRLEILLLKIVTESSSGIRPSKLSRADLDEAFELGTRLHAPTTVYIISYLHQHEFDLGNYDEAERWLLQYLEKSDEVPNGFRNAVWLDACLFYAVARKNLEQAERYWNMFKPSAVVPKSQILVTQAALAQLHHQGAVAKQKATEAIDHLPNMIDKGAALATKTRINEILDSMKEPAH